MRRQSKKTAARERECREFRRALVARVGICECCGHDPNRVKPGRIAWELRCHEIANGPNRQKALDKAHSLLCTCWPCNSEKLTDKLAYPEARQLAYLLKSRPGDYDLRAHNMLVNPNAPNRVTEEEVLTWYRQMVH